MLALLREQGHIVEREGAVWFASSQLGESKDNVLIRSDGVPTYFATDIAYHYDKFMLRGFDRVIDVWGADHQGHVSRVKAGITATGGDGNALDVLLYQLVTLKRAGAVVPLSKRAGEIVTLREVVGEVGRDAARFFFLLSSAGSAMDFDLDLAKRKTDENPVYYVQYAHARIAGVLRNAVEQGLSAEGAEPSLLTHEAEQALIRKLLLLPEVLEEVVAELAPHRLPHYAQELAQSFHVFYTQCRVLTDDEPLSRARLLLLESHAHHPRPHAGADGHLGAGAHVGAMPRGRGSLDCPPLAARSPTFRPTGRRSAARICTPSTSDWMTARTRDRSWRTRAA